MYYYSKVHFSDYKNNFKKTMEIIIFFSIKLHNLYLSGRK